MAWTDPAGHVWVTGEVVTAANLNTYVRLNLEALYDAPFCRAFASAALGVASITITALALNTESQDNDAIHSTATNTTRFTPPTAGGYLVTGWVTYAGSTGGSQRTALLRLNGTTKIGQLDEPRNGAAETALSLVGAYRFSGSDYVELCAYQDSGASLNVVTAVMSIAHVSRAL